MSSLCRSLVVVGLSCVVPLTPTAAEPVSITSGFLLVSGPFGPASIELAGTQGFSLEARVNPDEGIVAPVQVGCGQPCAGGSRLSIGAVLDTSAFSFGTATLGGVAYPQTSSLEDEARIGLEWFGTVRLPVVGSGPVIVTAPFTATGRFSLPSGSVPLRGLGTASLWLSPADTSRGFDDGGWLADAIRYEFAEPAPIPEPATMTLLGIGLAATALRVRSRRSRCAS